MNKQNENVNYKQIFREFVIGRLGRKYGSRRLMRGAACQEFIKYVVDLGQYPIADDCQKILVWQGEGGVTRIASIPASASGIDTLCIDCKAGDDYHGALLLKDIAECTHRLPIALCIEPRSASIDIAKEQVQDWIDAYDAAGLMNGHSVVVVPALTQDLRVPASCRTVFEGYIQKSEVAATEAATLTVHITCITGQL